MTKAGAADVIVTGVTGVVGASDPPILVYEEAGFWHVACGEHRQQFKVLSDASEFIDRLAKRFPLAEIWQGAVAREEAQKAGAAGQNV